MFLIYFYCLYSTAREHEVPLQLPAAWLQAGTQEGNSGQPETPTGYYLQHTFVPTLPPLEIPSAFKFVLKCSSLGCSAEDIMALHGHGHPTLATVFSAAGDTSIRQALAVSIWEAGNGSPSESVNQGPISALTWLQSDSFQPEQFPTAEGKRMRSHRGDNQDLLCQ